METEPKLFKTRNAWRAWLARHHKKQEPGNLICSLFVYKYGRGHR